MEFIKNRISTSITKTFKMVQTTLEDDLNVPDTKPDLDKIIQTKGEVVIQEVEALIDKIRIEGELTFRILYATPSEGLGSFIHQFPFDETVYMEGTLPSDCVKVGGMLEDLNVSMINSRKLEVKSLLSLMVRSIDTDILEGIVSVEGENSLECNYRPNHITGLVVNKKDMVRLKQEVNIPSNKPNVSEVLWDSVSLRNQEVKLLDEKIMIKGELLFFVLYQGEEEHIPFQNLEWEIPFETMLDCRESKEHMIGNIRAAIGSKQIEVKPDVDGEERVLGLECTLDLDLKIYEEEEREFLWDAYSPSKNFELERNNVSYESLIVKNNARSKVNQHVHIKEHQGKVLQICHVEGEAKVDETTCTPEGIQVEGIIVANLIYVSSDDRYPINCLSAMLPFSYLVEAKGIKEEDHYEIEASLEQINAIMIDGDEVEIKAGLQLDLIAFSVTQGSVVAQIVEQPFNEAEFTSMPGIVGYVVQDQESMWDIAKRYYTTTASIQKMNEMEDCQVMPGMKLLIIKDVREPLEA